MVWWAEVPLTDRKWRKGTDLGRRNEECCLVVVSNWNDLGCK